MNTRTWTWVVLCVGVGVLLVPLFLPPDPIYPSLLSFLPYLAFLVASLMTKSSEESRVLLVFTLMTVALGSFAYLDTLRFNLLLSWQVSGLVASFIPWFQLAVCLPLTLWLLLRRRRNRGMDDGPVVPPRGEE